MTEEYIFYTCRVEMKDEEGYYTLEFPVKSTELDDVTGEDEDIIKGKAERRFPGRFQELLEVSH